MVSYLKTWCEQNVFLTSKLPFLSNYPMRNYSKSASVGFGNGHEEEIHKSHSEYNCLNCRFFSWKIARMALKLTGPDDISLFQNSLKSYSKELLPGIVLQLCCKSLTI